MTIGLFGNRNDVLNTSEIEALGINEAAIRALRAEAGEAGDDKQVRICETALTGRRWAVEECARVIREAGKVES